MPDGRDCCRRPSGWQQKKSQWSSTDPFSRGERALLPFSGGPAVPPGSVVPWFFNKINFQTHRNDVCIALFTTIQSCRWNDTIGGGRQPVPQNGDINKKSGTYKSLCCGAEIVINSGAP